MTRIVSRVGIKAVSCDSPNNGNVLLILGQALPTRSRLSHFCRKAEENATLWLRRIKGRRSSDTPSPLVALAALTVPCKPPP